jgi:fructokinase
VIQIFVVVGEAVVDLVGRRGERTFVAHPGGSPANVSLGLARLGAPVTLITRLGEDAYGQMIRSHLEADGVLVDSSFRADAPTSLAIALLDAGAATYDFRIDWDIGTIAPLPADTRCVHTGSLATVFPPGDQAVIDLVRSERMRGHVTVSYDPNVRPAVLKDPAGAQDRIESVVSLADVVKVSDEDLRWLYPGERDDDVARRWLAMGPLLVVVTRAEAGVHAVTRAHQVTRPAVAVDLVDTVGAGDAYMSGLLDGLRLADLLGGRRRDALANVDESRLITVLDRAGVVAAITCSRLGADPPTHLEVDAAIA